MFEWLALLLIVGAGLAMGWLIIRQFVGRKRPSLLLAFTGLTLGLAVISWLALVLAELRFYSLGNLLLAGLVVAGFLGIMEWWRKRNGSWPPQSDEVANGKGTALFTRLPNWLEPLFLVIWLVVAAWLFLRPHEWVTGAADAGVYVNLGASLHRQGGFLIQDELLAGLDPDLASSLLRPLDGNEVAPQYILPGFYVTGEPQGEITPQFYPLHPLWQAISYGLAQLPAEAGLVDGDSGLIDGIQAELMMSGFWALLGSLAVYLVVRQYVGWETAALALVALSITALQVWFARYPTTEMLTQFTLWSGLLGLSLWLAGDKPASLWALLAGVGLGLAFLVRIDVLVMLPVLVLLALWLLAGGRRAIADRASVKWFLAPLGLLVAHSLIHAWWQSRPYFVEHAGLGLRLVQSNGMILVVVMLAAVLGIWLLRRVSPNRLPDPEQYRRVALGALVMVALVFAAYGWFVRPVVGQTVVREDFFSQVAIPLTDHENWPRLGWYLSPVGLALGVAGLCVMIWKLNRRTAMILAIGALFTALYLWSLRANPHQVYAMRRFVPIAVPFFTVAAAVFVGFLARQKALWLKMVAGLLAIAWLTGLVWSARGFISQVDHQGLVVQLQDLSQGLEPDSVLLFNDPAAIGQGDFFGTPLKFLFDHDVYTVRNWETLDKVALLEVIDLWQNSGRAVYWIGDSESLAAAGQPLGPQKIFTIQSQHLEESYEHKPTALLSDEWTLVITSLNR